MINQIENQDERLNEFKVSSAAAAMHLNGEARTQKNQTKKKHTHKIKTKKPKTKNQK